MKPIHAKKTRPRMGAWALSTPCPRPQRGRAGAQRASGSAARFDTQSVTDDRVYFSLSTAGWDTHALVGRVP